MLLKAFGATDRGIVHLDIDDPVHRHRPWSISDILFVYSATHFIEARKTGRALFHRFSAWL